MQPLCLCIPCWKQGNWDNAAALQQSSWVLGRLICKDPTCKVLQEGLGHYRHQQDQGGSVHFLGFAKGFWGIFLGLRDGADSFAAPAHLPGCILTCGSSWARDCRGSSCRWDLPHSWEEATSSWPALPNQAEISARMRTHIIDAVCTRCLVHIREQ